MSTRRIVVVGGGVSGLAVAHHLTRGENAPDVIVLESRQAVGGWISTLDLSQQAGVRTGPVDVGPDSMLVRAQVVQDLLQQIGLDQDARPPAGTGAYIWTAAGLRKLPRSSVFGVPDSPWKLMRSGLVSAPGMLRAAADLVLPATKLDDDPSIAAILKPRLGTQVFSTLVEPMLGGVHAGRAERLSARSAVPEVFAVAQRNRSVIKAVRSLGPRTGAGPGLAGFPGGMSQLPAALADSVAHAGGRVRTDAAVTGLSVNPAGGYVVHLADDETVTADDVVLAVPTWAAAPLLMDVAPRAAAVAEQIEYASVATMTLVLDPSAVTLPPGTGFLVPPDQRRLLVGCTWMSAKWPRPDAAPTDGVVVRCMVGRDGDERWASMDDDQLQAAILGELAQALGASALSANAVLARVVRRMPNALPQYTIGHEGRVGAIERNVGATAPGVWVTGAGYRGLGIAACLTNAKTLAENVINRVR